MKVIKLVSARFENFKKLNRQVEFGERKTWIYAKNRTGKSSVADGIFWVLFGKSSTGKSEGKEFRPRPYDMQGIDVDHVDVVVELTLLIDGVEVLLQKTCLLYTSLYVASIITVSDVNNVTFKKVRGV